MDFALNMSVHMAINEPRRILFQLSRSRLERRLDPGEGSPRTRAQPSRCTSEDRMRSSEPAPATLPAVTRSSACSFMRERRAGKPGPVDVDKAREIIERGVLAELGEGGRLRVGRGGEEREQSVRVVRDGREEGRRESETREQEA
jgi:hypothetical protein